jgi:hypothetical protein
MTDAFAAALADDAVVSLGDHALRGVSLPQRLLTVRPLAR